MRNRRYRLLVSVLLLTAGLTIILYTAITTAEPAKESKDLTLTFNRNALGIIKFGDRHVVSLKQPRCMYPADKAGAPELPARFVRVVVPRRAKFEKVTVTRCRTQKLRGQFDIDFARPPCRPGQKAPPAGPDAEIYGSNKAYPPEKVEFLRAGMMRGHQIFFFRVNPVQYLPKSKELLFHSRIDLRIEYSIDNARKFTLKPRRKSRAFQRMLKKFVENPADLDTLAGGEPEASASEESGPPPQPMSPGDDIQYLIICSETFAATFQQLADWKKQKGVPAEVVTVEYIETNYSGEDTQEKIKYCIIDYVNDSGTIYILLGGDIDTIPPRECYGWVNTSPSPTSDTTIPCDLYYAGLDDIDWNDGGHPNRCGEIESDGDTIDMEPDVFVGRFSCKTAAEVEAYVNKVLEYEKEAPATGFCKEILLSGCMLWGWFDPDDDYTYYASSSYSYVEGWLSDAEVWTMRMYDNYIVPYWSPNKKEFFDTTDSLTLYPTALSDEIDNGYGFVNMNTHGNVRRWGVETSESGVWATYYNTDHAAAQTNDKECSIVYTGACITNGFDGWGNDSYNCLSEVLTRNADGGVIGFIGSSRYGWGIPGSYWGGSSDTYNRTFYEKLLGEDLYHLGEAYTEHKWHNVDLCGQYGSYRWLQFAINLMGDPELPVWTENPQTMTVIYPSEIAPGSQTIYIKAEPGALVCLWKVVGASDEVYVYGYADESGVFSAVINPATVGTMKLTVTKHNYYPVEADITVTTSPSLYIVTVVLPGSETGQPYSATLTAAGGTSPYSWSDIAGSLPNGLTLNFDGTITGTPTTAGSSTFTAQVQDDAPDTASREFTITVSLDTPALQDFPAPEYNGNYTATWTGSDAPTHYELQESSSFTTTIQDDAESGTGQWTVDGFSLSTAQSHSASNSFFGGKADDLNNSLTYADPIVVGAATQVSFWRWYNIEENWDYAFFEISINDGATWKKLKLYTGAATSWTQETVDLSSYAGTSILMRFRYYTDTMITEEGFYIDDIQVTDLSIYNWTTLSASIGDKWYDITGRAPGTYYYRVRAFEGANTSGWSEIKSITVLPDALFLEFYVDKATAKPYEELTYTLRYDNDNSAEVASLVLEAPIPADTSYAIDSAEGANSPHSGASITVTYYDGSIWHDDAWDDANPTLVERIRWTFSNNVGLDTGGDSEGTCDGPYPDTDSGEVSYKVTIK